MAKIDAEIAHNYSAFAEAFPQTIAANAAASKGKQVLLESYARIAVLNSIKLDLIDPRFSKGAAQFFYEAHNDALISHVSASYASWRTALQSLRGFLENTMSSIFFHEHPVELEKWEAGSFKISPRELRDYCVTHPRLEAVSKAIDLKSSLDSEYATLSKAVHASNSLFRMTTAKGETNLGTYSDAELGKWSSRERATISISTVLLVSILHTELDGAKRPQLRRSLSLAISATGRKALRDSLGIVIPNP